ncbi:MAG: N-acetylmuramoyl-L-alanine amidase [Selenomonadaceae bacterium]|nr:N-acetylmuramoyl-L-alanine amidase [Selenomonadaceae bacterium]MBR1858661.1 N-acetylmuramoyl-L-alanine amidase [Selenomonadaceae bacterium]
MAQYNPSTVRVVIETMAENVVFFLDGGPAGKRLVIDLGLGAEQPGFDKKVSPEMTTPSAENTGTDNRSAGEVLRPDERDNRSSGNNNDNNDNTGSNNTHKNIEVNRTPGIAGKKIVIDAGHGGNDAGAIGPSGVMEKTVTLRVALELKQLLEADGATVIMTRETDTEVAERGRHATDVEELKARCDVANNAEADMFISIHADSFTNPAARGSTGYYFGKGTDDSRRLADCIRKALCESLNTPSRGTQPCNFYVVRNTDMPATLIELAFISNPTEEKLLNSDEGVTKAAKGIFAGIKDYCS